MSRFRPRWKPRRPRTTVHTWWFALLPGKSHLFWFYVAKELKRRRLRVSDPDHVRRAIAVILERGIGEAKMQQGSEHTPR